MMTSGITFVVLFVALTFYFINGEICDEDAASEYVCDMGSCCKKNGIWDCIYDEEDTSDCEETSKTSGWQTWHTILTVVGGISFLMAIVGCCVRMNRYSTAVPRRDDEERFANQEVRS